MTFKIASINCILILFFAIFLFKGCSTKTDGSKIKNFEESKNTHQKVVNQMLDGAGDNGNFNKDMFSKSQVTVVEGDKEPVWANEYPIECGKIFFCGDASIGSINNNKCPDKHECKVQNRAAAVSSLKKNIETRIRDRSRLYLYSQKDNKEESFYKEFEKHILEQGSSKLPLKNIYLRHFYLTPQKKLFTMAMMEIPKDEKSSDESQEKAELSNLPPLLLALTIDHNNGDLNEEELMGIVQIRLPELLSEYSFNLADNESLRYFKKTKISDILTTYKETLEKKPGSIILLTSLKGEIGTISSRIWKGMTRMYLSFSAYRSKGKLIWKKTYETKFFDKREPITLSTSDRETNYNKTLKKGFKEIEKKGILKEFKKVF